MSISAAQCRAARALLDWSQDQLAENAQVARPTIADFERNVRMPMRNNLVSIISALEAAGISFIPDDEGGAGVRFRKVEIEYSKAVKPKDDGIVISVRYRGTSFFIFVPRNVINDIDRTNYRTAEQRVKAVQNHLPIFLRAGEEEIVKGRILNENYIVLSHEKLPEDLF
jgi:transcriptional regulator with XRE-family HTH domain